jgi:hypothetical protein
MPVMNCVCGHRYEWSEGDDLFALLKGHNTDAHAELNIPDAALRQLAQAHARMTPWDGTITPLAGEPDVRPLRPALADDYLRGRPATACSGTAPRRSGTRRLSAQRNRIAQTRRR